MDSKELSAGARIMLLRSEKGFSREYLSERAGISTKFLYNIEIRGSGFSARTLLRIAQELEVSTDYILMGKGNPQYDEKLFHTIERFEPDTLETVKRLLEIAYELAGKR